MDAGKRIGQFDLWAKNYLHISTCLVTMCNFLYDNSKISSLMWLFKAEGYGVRIV